MHRSPLLFIELARPEAPKEVIVDSSKSWLLSSISSYQDYHIFGFGVPGMRKGEDLGRIFDFLKPDKDGEFTLELGVTLPDLLPDLVGQQDYILEVALAEDDRRALALSNHMARVNYQIDGRSYHAVMPYEKFEENRGKEGSHIPQDASPQRLRTTVTMRFSIAGLDAEEALENNIEKCLRELMACLNLLRSALQSIPSNSATPLSAQYETQTFPYCYMVMMGEEEGRFGHGKIATHIGRVAMVGGALSEDDAELLNSYLQGARKIDPVSQMAASASASVESGMLSYALLLMVIAGEMATARFIRERLLEKGVSKGKWDESKNDVTYSQMLNLHLFSLTPPHMKPDRQLLGELNRARALRNELMHEGKFSLSHSDVRSLLESTKEYLKYLEKVSEATGFKENR